MAVGIPPGPVVFGAAMLEGVTETGERMVLVTLEQPEMLPGFHGSTSKEVLERLHLEKYRFDHLLRFGVVPFDSVETGGNPPDFVVATESGQVRLDCAVLAREDRRQAHRLFRILSERLASDAAGRDFSGIAGCVVSVWFGEQMQEQPPKRTDASLLDPLLDALGDAHVDHAAHRALSDEIAKRGFPDVLPPIMTEGKTPDGDAGFIANVACEPEQAHERFGELGFGIQLHMPRQVTATDVAGELSRLVSKHDKPEIEALVITAGGPDRNGVRYPAEEAFASLAVTDGESAIEAAYLTQVRLHLWSACTIHDIRIKRV